MELDLQQLTTEVCRIATEAGNFLRKERRSFSRERVVEKHAHDYVSYVDKESERLLVAQLSALLPEAGFIAEEGSPFIRMSLIAGLLIRWTGRLTTFMTMLLIVSVSH